MNMDTVLDLTVCSLEEKCGEICIVGQHCHKKREDCQASTCYECQKTPDDEDIFFFFYHRVSMDCLDTGTKISDDGIKVQLGRLLWPSGIWWR